MNHPSMRHVVVGVDGSPHSLAALHWALTVAAEDGIINVVSTNHDRSEHSDLTVQWLESERVSALRSETNARVELHLVGREPAEVIAGFADGDHADLIVVGAHGGSAHLPRSIGSVTHKLLRLSPCPIAVVKEGWTEPANGPIVVGIGDGRGTAASLRWALSVFADTPLHLVRAVDLHPIAGLDGMFDVMASYLEPQQLIRWAEQHLDDIVAANAGETAHPIATTAVAGSAGGVLVAAAEDARALVVGKHFDGVLTGYFTGRCLQHTITHATCPVIVVPPDRPE